MQIQEQDEKMTAPPFHHAIPVRDVEEARKFYVTLFGATEGRRDGSRWQDLNFFGHQLVLHFTSKDYKAPQYFNPVDSKQVPVPHFGVCLTVPKWKELAARLVSKEKEWNICWVIRPCLRFEGAPGAQFTMFLLDPSGSALEFKAMVNPDNLFAKYDVASSSKL